MKQSMLRKFIRILACVFAIATTELPAQDGFSFLGRWYRVSPDSVELRIENYNVDTFSFVMTNWNPNVYGHVYELDTEEGKLARIDGAVAYFDDTGAISDGRPLYYEDEEACKMLFKIRDSNTMEVYEQDCYMIYGGAWSTWGGVYTRVNKGQEWLSKFNP